MEFTKIISPVHVIKMIGEALRREITGIEYDSRSVTPGCVFVALRGFTTDGHRFLQDAISKGAAVLVIEDDESVPDHQAARENIVKVVVRDTRKALAQLNAAYYEQSVEKLKIIGVTGTKGKTTTTFFLSSIFEQAGMHTGVIGSIGNYIGGEKAAARQAHAEDGKATSPLTTPESSDLHRLFRQFAEAGCAVAVMEVSSHSLVLHRAAGIPFAGAIFSNLTSDHMDFHKTKQEYASAKKILFDNLSESAIAVVNSDDEYAGFMVTDTKAEVITYGKSQSNYRISNITSDLKATTFIVTHDGKSYSLTTALLGTFNAYNAASAFALAVSLGIPAETAAAGIAATKQVPGRFEVITGVEKIVIVDYSHTSDSLEKAIRNAILLRKPNQPVYTVFGCGGDRDKTKRPEMGKIATELSDHVFITDDNPRNEDPEQILADILKGISKANYTIELDRDTAIRKAIMESPGNAIILIAGKGHEDYHLVKGVKYHFSDKERAKHYLQKLEAERSLG